MTKDRSARVLVIPLWWVQELTGPDLKRMCQLRSRYDMFASASLQKDKDCDLRYVMWESQAELAEHLGFSRASRSKVADFLARMEELGAISVIRTTTVNDKGEIRPRNYTVVNDNNLLKSYGRESWN